MISGYNETLWMVLFVDTFRVQINRNSFEEGK